MSSQDIVALYVDLLRERGVRPLPRMVGQMARKVKYLLDDERIAPEIVASGMARMVTKGYTSPSALEQFVTEAALRSNPDPVQSALERMVEERGGWPTGTRMVRGQTGVSYVEDALGYDTAPYATPWARPKREQVEAALRERDGRDLSARRVGQ